MSVVRRKSTFSIVAADLEAGEVGCAVQSRYFSVGSVVPVGARRRRRRRDAGGGRRRLRRSCARGARARRLAGGRRSSASSRTTEAGRRASSGWSTADGRAAAFTGARLPRLGRSSHRRRASPCRGTSSPARRWSTRWRAPTRRRSGRSSSVSSPRSRRARRRAATGAASSPRRSSSSASARAASRARASTASATCASRITPSRSSSCAAWSGSGRLGGAASRARALRARRQRPRGRHAAGCARARGEEPGCSTTSRVTSRSRAGRDAALAHLRRAIELDPSFRELARDDADFEPIRAAVSEL